MSFELSQLFSGCFKGVVSPYRQRAIWSPVVRDSCRTPFKQVAAQAGEEPFVLEHLVLRLNQGGPSDLARTMATDNRDVSQLIVPDVSVAQLGIAILLA